MKPNKFQKRIESIFPGVFTQYREQRSAGAGFVEFWVSHNEGKSLNTYIYFEQLQKLAKLLGTTDILITGGDIGGEGCDRCRTEDNAVYVLAEGVDFK